MNIQVTDSKSSVLCQYINFDLCLEEGFVSNCRIDVYNMSHTQYVNTF